LVFDYDFDEHLNIGANVIATSGSYLHGNENNANQSGTVNVPSGAYIEGSGFIDGYATLNFNGTYRVDKNFEIFARLTNALNKDYYTAGFLTNNVYNPNGSLRTSPNDWTNENDVVPGAPRQVWGGVRARF
jgi:outer membrane receptor protein involved in Fe transport